MARNHHALPRPCGEVLLSLLQKGVVVLQVWIKRQRRQIDSGSRRNHRARIGRRRTAGTACRSQKERKRECQRECEREYEQRARATKSVGSGHRSPRGVGKEKVRFSWRHHSGRQRAVKSYARPNGPAHANRCLAALRGRKPLGSRRERSRLPALLRRLFLLSQRQCGAGAGGGDCDGGKGRGPWPGDRA